MSSKPEQPLSAFRLADWAEFNLDKPFATLDTQSFSQDVRDFHTDRVPRYAVDFSGICCPYCHKPKDRRSLSVDHIIPVRIFCRYKVLRNDIFRNYQAPPVIERRDGKTGKAPRKIVNHRFDPLGADPDVLIEAQGKRQKKLPDLVTAAVRDHDNLVLCCRSCNGLKSDTMPDVPLYNARFGHWRNTIHRRMLACPDPMVRQVAMANQTILQNIRSHPKSAFLLSGAVQSLRTLQSPSDEVEWAVINKLGIGRPSMELDELVPQLMGRHAKIDIAGKVLRLCMYCLGFFNKQSFTLDHFRPVNRGAQSADFTFQSSAHDYNNPANLVAVCHSCNSSKSNYTVSRQWVASRTKKRQDDGLPGFEVTAGPGDDADQLVEEAIDTIGTVLNLS